MAGWSWEVERCRGVEIARRMLQLAMLVSCLYCFVTLLKMIQENYLLCFKKTRLTYI